MNKKILEIKNLEVKFHVRQSFLTAIRNVSFNIYDNEIIAIVGESGSGKSVITNTFMGMLDNNGFISDGKIIYYPQKSDDFKYVCSNYLDEGINLTDLQNELMDKYTKKSIIKSLILQKKIITKKIVKNNNLNIKTINSKIKKYKNKVEILNKNENLFLKNNKKNHKISKYEQKLESYLLNYKLMTDKKFKNNYYEDLNHNLFSLKKNIIKIKGFKLLNLYMLRKIIYYIKTIKNNFNNKDFLNDIKIYLQYKYYKDLYFKNKNKKFLENQKLYIENKLNNIFKSFNLDNLEKNYFDYKEKIKNIEKDKTKNIIYSYLKFIASKEFNFSAERNAESLILKLLNNDNFDKNLFNEILSKYNYYKRLSILRKLRAIKLFKDMRGKTIATIFQDPMTSLNPLLSVGYQISEVLRKKRGLSKKEAKIKTIELLKKVGIPNAEKRYKDIPGQYSGGMRQRVVIAIALAAKPKILICDEPTTALDVTIQAQIIKLIKDLQKEYRFTVIFITHDLGVVAKLADRVAVMYAGQIIEYGITNEIFFEAKHPYTWALLSSLPQLGVKGEELYSIKGTPPSLFNTIKGDAFSLRSDYALKIDKILEPPMFKVTDTHYAKSWLLDDRAPESNKPEILNDMETQIEDM
ncbi:oligopeptide/dipeptide ABC transporter ATP-binding protein [Spiroplasma turonicum]|uniref:Oligopeptide ABC transporter ATP-binding protein n=1 Tax=Spiroplasma turonicum TaxID=216946 RepID=A0A0K1P6G9_9MOLU|nr:oligopeptide/dipeptide ABC transporter ATP-binding protein [Spiroplasma turonicum]AKU79799.1 oligopeptide ABC transporter ATP-binding protein [Spiroplasma turonicum]ALX70817.1 oligopeptide ABC transporter ATP-binding protein [Spiroplasma turonicum]